MNTLVMENENTKRQEPAAKIASPKAKASGTGLSSMEKKLLSTVIALIAIVAVFGFMTDTFFEARNVSNLLRQTAINGILAVGMTWVILLAGVDLSVGSVVAAVGIVVAMLQTSSGWGAQGWGGVLATTGVAVALGTVIGAFNAAWISGLGIHSFVITFGMMVIARGVAMILSNGSSISPMGPELNELGAGYLGTLWTALILFGSAGVWALYIVWDEWQARRRNMATATWRVALKVLSLALLPLLLFSVFQAYSGLPIPVLLFGIVALAGSWTLTQTRFGRYIYAVGGNPEAARLAGIPVKKVIFLVFTAMGALSGLSALVLTARLNGATPTAGNLFELDAIAAVVIGGTSLKGGKGTVLGSIIGALIIASLNNGMSLMNVPTFYQMPLKGAIVILAVAIDALVERKRSV